MKIPIIILLTSVCCSYGQEADSGGRLISAIANLKTTAGITVPLARDEFPAIEEKFKGDQYNDLVARIHSPVLLADIATRLDIDMVSNWVTKKDKKSVSDTVL